VRPSSEKWLPVVGHEGTFEVSNLGRVRSVTRTVQYVDGRSRLYESQEIKVSMGPRGYLIVGLSGKTPTLHKVVATAFHGQRPEGLCARHLDGNVHNNRADNLAWGTYHQNRLDQQSHGTDAKRNKDVCVRGHLLSHPNLSSYHWKLGLRVCRACHTGRSYAKRNPTTVMEEESDRYYESYGFKPVNKRSRLIGPE
jgi:hypothetical protein